MNDPYTPYLDEMLRDAMSSGPEILSRIFADNAGSGAEWIPNNTFAELEREMQFQTGAHSVFADRPMTQSAMKLPYQEGNLRPYIGAVPTTNDPANYTLSDRTTRENTLSVVTLAVATQVDRDASEDSIIAVVPEISGDIASAFSFGYDDIVMNGDTAGTHQDAIATWNTRGIWGAAGLGGADDHRRAGMGLRARAQNLGTNVDSTAAQTSAGFRTVMKTLGAEYFSKMNTTGSLKWFVSPEFFLGTMLGFTDLITWDQAGPNATILTGLLGGRKGPSPGSVGFLYNVEVILTPFLTADLAATGLYTGAGATNTAVVCDVADFEWRTRLGLQLETDTNIRNNTVTTVARTRRLFRTKANDTTSNKDNVATAYNLTS